MTKCRFLAFCRGVAGVEREKIGIFFRAEEITVQKSRYRFMLSGIIFSMGQYSYDKWGILRFKRTCYLIKRRCLPMAFRAFRMLFIEMQIIFSPVEG